MSIIYIDGYDYYDENTIEALWERLPGGAADSFASIRMSIDVAYARTNALIWHVDVRAASTSALTLASAPATIDGVTLAPGNRVLLKDQAVAAENGVYDWFAAGSPMTRSTAENTSAELDKMAVYVTEGTDNGDTSWTLATPLPITVDTTALSFVRRFGTPYVHGRGMLCTANSGGGGAVRHLGANYEEVFFGIATLITSTGAYGKPGAFVVLAEDGVTHVDLRFSATGKIILTRAGTLLATGTTTIVPGTYYYVELRVKIGDSGVGTAELRVDGVTEFTFSGDTRNGGSGVVNQFTQKLGVVDGSYNQWFDDHYMAWPDPDSIYHNDFLGDQQVIVQQGVAVGAFSDWAPSSGTNEETVDDLVPNGDTDYNSSSGTGDRDTFAFSEVRYAQKVNALAIRALMRKDDAGRKAASAVTELVGSYLGPGVGLGNSYRYVSEIQHVNPATGEPWLTSDLNDAEFGYQEVT